MRNRLGLLSVFLISQSHPSLYQTPLPNPPSNPISNLLTQFFLPNLTKAAYFYIDSRQREFNL